MLINIESTNYREITAGKYTARFGVGALEAAIATGSKVWVCYHYRKNEVSNWEEMVTGYVSGKRRPKAHTLTVGEGQLIIVGDQII